MNLSSNNVPIKIPVKIFKELKLNLKFIWKNKVAKNRHDTPEKTARGLASSDIKIYYKATIITQNGTGPTPPRNRKKEPSNKPVMCMETCYKTEVTLKITGKNRQKYLFH